MRPTTRFYTINAAVTLFAGIQPPVYKLVLISCPDIFHHGPTFHTGKPDVAYDQIRRHGKRYSHTTIYVATQDTQNKIHAVPFTRPADDKGQQYTVR